MSRADVYTESGELSELVIAVPMLVAAAQMGQWDEDLVLHLLPKLGFDINLADAFCLDKSGIGLLHWAAKQGGVQSRHSCRQRMPAAPGSNVQ